MEPDDLGLERFGQSDAAVTGRAEQRLAAGFSVSTDRVLECMVLAVPVSAGLVLECLVSVGLVLECLVSVGLVLECMVSVGLVLAGSFSTGSVPTVPAVGRHEQVRAGLLGLV